MSNSPEQPVHATEPETHGKEGVLTEAEVAAVKARRVSPSLLKSIAATPPVQLEPEIEAYRAQRAETAKRFGGMIPLAQGIIASVDITQKGADDAYVAVVFRTSQFDQIALMAAPNHQMRFVLFEDQRPVATPAP